VHVPFCGLVGAVRLRGQCRKVNVEVPPRVRDRTECVACVCEAGDGTCTEGENAGGRHGRVRTSPARRWLVPLFHRW
jgi:hypothetical protein